MPNSSRIDLHAHSTASDGTESPAELVRTAVRVGLDVVALTDHDTTAGWDEAAAVVPPGLTLVPGAEISCGRDGVSAHLLGYLFDRRDRALGAELARTRDDRVPRARAMVDKLAAAGVPLTWEQVLARVDPGATVGRPHLADALVSAGVVADRTEAFDSYLHRNSPFYVRHRTIDPVAAVRLVRGAGGVSVLAHAGAHKRGRVLADEVIAEMAAAGLGGLEVDHPDHDEETRARMRALARALDVLPTGSSDYHGTGKVSRLGEETTDPEVYEALVASATGTRPVRA